MGPVGVRHDHQLALGVDEDALAENASGRIAAVVIGPPLVAIAAPGAANVGALGGGLGPPALGHDALAVYLRAIQDEHAQAGIVAWRCLHAAAANLLAGFAQKPGGLLLHACRAPHFFCQVGGQGLFGGLLHQGAHQVGLARAVQPAGACRYIAR